jgi:hypothetical protein
MSGPAWQALTGLPAWEITQIPRDDEPRPESPASDAADRGAVRRVQALAAAYQRGAPTVFGWIRDQAGGPVRVMAAGPGLMAAADGGGETVLTLPAGARARPLSPGGGASLFTALGCWVPVGIITDALLADPGQDREPGARRAAGRLPPSLEEALLGSWPLPFGWIVIAEPVAGGQLRDMVSQVALAQLSAQRYDSPRARLTARRAEGRHAELRRAAATGLWHIRLLAGGETPDAAAQVAGLLCASADLDGLPYALVPAADCGAIWEILGGSGPPGTLAGPSGNRHGLLHDVMAMQPAADTAPHGGPGSPLAGQSAAVRSGNSPDDEDPGPEFPCAGSSQLLAALARPPAREVPGIQFVLRPDFDVTPETGPGALDGPPNRHLAGSSLMPGLPGSQRKPLTEPTTTAPGMVRRPFSGPVRADSGCRPTRERALSAATSTAELDRPHPGRRPRPSPSDSREWRPPTALTTTRPGTEGRPSSAPKRLNRRPARQIM